MKLYYIPGACSLASHILLREVGADFELEAVDPSTGLTESGQKFAAVNSKGYVPALELDSGEVLSEGAAVLQFIADSAPDQIELPAPGTVSRARLQEYLNYTASELHKAFSPLFAKSSDESAKADARAKVASKFDYLEALLADGRQYLVDERFSPADAYLFVVAGWARVQQIDLGRWPHLSGFVSRIAERPTVLAAIQAEGIGS
ncbi:MAG: glutathione transferase GstA [Pseudomonadota bacterium]